MKTALYFGSFNPPHKGHIAIAKYVLNEGYADELWFVVSPHNPLKEQGVLADEKDRLEMTRIAAQLISGVSVCEEEFSMPKPSYTIDTLERLSRDFPEREFSIVMGEDNLADIDKWRNYTRILSDYRVLVYPRKDAEAVVRDNVVMMSGAPVLEVSSTAIRAIVASGGLVIDLLPKGVFDYIIYNKLYGQHDR